MSMTVIEVKKSGSESNSSLLRRFSRSAQESRLVQLVKARRHEVRKPSKLSQKTSMLKRIVRRKANDRLRKLGKIA